MPIARSAEAPTLVMTGGVILLERFGSGVLPPPPAILVKLEMEFGARTFKMKLVTALAARLKFVHNTWLPLTAPPPLALTKVTDAGKLSVTDKPVAVEGPRLVTEMVYAKLAPRLTLTGALLLTATSATGVTLVKTGGLVLFVGLGSLTGLLTVAVLERPAPSAGAETVRIRFVLEPAARSPMLPQRTCVPLSTPPAVALTKVTPAGKLSVTDKLVAVDGPALATVIV